MDPPPIKIKALIAQKFTLEMRYVALSNFITSLVSIFLRWPYGHTLVGAMVPVHCITKITLQNKNAHRIILYEKMSVYA